MPPPCDLGVSKDWAAAISAELRRALRAVADTDQSLGRDVLDSKPRMRVLERSAIEFQIEPQLSDDPQRLLPNAFERELTESLRRIYSLVRRFVRAGTDLLRTGVDGSDTG